MSGEVGSEDEQLRREEDQRNRTIARPLTVHEWPLFECAVVRLPGGIDRVQVKLSLVLLDALSEMTLRRELETLYEDIDAALPPIGVRFRDYAIALSDGLAKTKAYQKDVDHWMGRLDGLPGPPALPLLLGDAILAITSSSRVRLVTDTKFNREVSHWLLHYVSVIVLS